MANAVRGTSANGEEPDYRQLSLHPPVAPISFPFRVQGMRRKGKYCEMFFEIRDTRITIEGFHKLVTATGLRIVNQRLYFINPNYQVKFGLNPRILSPVIGKIPYVRNFSRRPATICWQSRRRLINLQIERYFRFARNKRNQLRYTPFRGFGGVVQQKSYGIYILSIRLYKVFLTLSIPFVACPATKRSVFFSKSISSGNLSLGNIKSASSAWLRITIS